MRKISLQWRITAVIANQCRSTGVAIRLLFWMEFHTTVKPYWLSMAAFFSE